MTSQTYFKLAAKAFLSLALVPTVFGLALILENADFFGMPLGYYWGMLTLIGTAASTGLWMLATAIAVRQPTFIGALMTGAGLPLLVPPLLWWGRVIDGNNVVGVALLLCLPVAPVALGTAALHGGDGRRMLRRLGLFLVAASLPILLWLPDRVLETFWEADRPVLALLLAAAGIIDVWLAVRLPSGAPAGPALILKELLVAALLFAFMAAVALVLPGVR